MSGVGGTPARSDGGLPTIVVGHLGFQLVVEEIDELAPYELLAFTGEVTSVVGYEVSRHRTEIGTPDEEVVSTDQLVGQLGCYLGDVVAG